MLLANENNAQEDGQASKISLWSRSGPGLLLAAFAIFLFKAAPIYWPLTLTAFLGYAVIRLWKKSGLVLSLAALCCISILSFSSHHEHYWTSLLSASIALAWFLIYLGGQDREAVTERTEEAIRSLVQERQNLEKQIRDIKASLSAEKLKSNALASESLTALTKAAQLAETAEREKQALLEKCNLLSKNVSTTLSNESALQQALGNAQAQIAELTKVQEAAAPLRLIEENPDEQLQLKQLQYQLDLLREQFDDKSEALDKARKDLFATENALLVLQKAHEEKALEAPEETVAYSRDLKSLELTCLEMENQVLTLQDFITVLLTPKIRSSTTPKTKKTK